MEDIKYTSLRIPQSGQPVIAKCAARLSEALGERKSMGDVVIEAVRFIEVNGFNPYDLTNKTVIQEVRRMKDQTIGYLRTQEKEALKPLSASIQGLHSSVAELITHIQTSGLASPGQGDEKPPEPETAPKEASVNPLKSALEKKNKQLEDNFRIMNELKSSFKEKGGRFVLDLPVSRVNELLEQFFEAK